MREKKPDAVKSFLKNTAEAGTPHLRSSEKASNCSANNQTEERGKVKNKNNTNLMSEKLRTIRTKYKREQNKRVLSR